MNRQQEEKLLETLHQLETGTIHDQDFLFFKSFKNKKPIIVDIGANRGQSIASFFEIFPEGRIHSFEANPFFFQFLKN